jgi:DNA modification methylase
MILANDIKEEPGNWQIMMDKIICSDCLNVLNEANSDILNNHCKHCGNEINV